jgi:DNA replication and repair protein RecF
MTTPYLARLILDHYRSYPALDARFDGRPVWLAGANGAGKTNILEALTMLSGGRSLRGASLLDCAREGDPGTLWTVSVTLEGADGPVQLGARLDRSGLRGKRVVHLDGQAIPPARTAALLPLVWATPAHDRLFVEGASERRRFFDRLVAAHDPAHGPRVAKYERLMRERVATLQTPHPDGMWLDTIEGELVAVGAAITTARQGHLKALQARINARPDDAFPKADLALSDTACSADGFRAARPRDAEAGRALVGPHRADVIVHHRPTGHAAAMCSTGEQKALLYGILLATARASETDGRTPPILLLDEAMAHFDGLRRAALAAAIVDLGGQAFLTGVDAALFSDFGARAQGFHVRAAGLHADDRDCG